MKLRFCLSSTILFAVLVLFAQPLLAATYVLPPPGIDIIGENKIVYACSIYQHKISIQVRKLFIFTGENVLIVSDYQMPAIENFLL